MASSRSWLCPLRASALGPSQDRLPLQELLNDLESVFVTKGMERDPHSSVSDFTASLKSLPTVLPPEQSDACEAVVARIAHLVKAPLFPCCQCVKWHVCAS